MIEINGLSVLEVKILDLLWECETQSDVDLLEEQFEVEMPNLLKTFYKCRDLLIAHQLDTETNTDVAYEYLKGFML